MTPGSQFKEKSYLVAKVINMPKPKFPDARPLPRLVLLPLPELTLKSRSGPKKSRPNARLRSEPELKQERPSPYVEAMLSSMDELRALIVLVQSFLNSKDKAVGAVAEWLKKLLDELAYLDSDIANGNLDGKVTADDVSGLDDSLTEFPDLEEILEESQDIFPWNMLSFLLVEIRRRGSELFHIAICSVDVIEAMNMSQTVKAMRYPIYKDRS
jgi:hypothetical protein